MKASTPVARWHGRRDRHNLVVMLGFGEQSLREHRGVGGRIALFLELGAGGGVEFDDAVIFVRRFLGRRIARTLPGAHMDQDGP